VSLQLAVFFFGDVVFHPEVGSLQTPDFLPSSRLFYFSTRFFYYVLAKPSRVLLSERLLVRDTPLAFQTTAWPAVVVK